MRPQGVAAPQFATVGGYVLPAQQLAQQAAAAGVRPAMMAMPGQPGQQVLVNPQFLYAQQMQLQAQLQAQQAAAAAAAARPAAAPQAAEPAPTLASTAGMRSASPMPGQQAVSAPPQPAVGAGQAARPPMVSSGSAQLLLQARWLESARPRQPGRGRRGQGECARGRACWRAGSGGEPALAGGPRGPPSCPATPRCAGDTRQLPHQPEDAERRCAALPHTAGGRGAHSWSGQPAAGSWPLRRSTSWGSHPWCRSGDISPARCSAGLLLAR